VDCADYVFEHLEVDTTLLFTYAKLRSGNYRPTGPVVLDSEKPVLQKVMTDCKAREFLV